MAVEEIPPSETPIVGRYSKAHAPCSSSMDFLVAGYFFVKPGEHVEDASLFEEVWREDLGPGKEKGPSDELLKRMRLYNGFEAYQGPTRKWVENETGIEIKYVELAGQPLRTLCKILKE